MQFVVLLALVLGNGLFTGAEIAILSVRKTRLAELAASGSQRARSLVDLRDDPERFFATIQVGITVLGVTTASFGAAALGDDVIALIDRVPGLHEYAERIALPAIIGGVSFLSLVFGELVPKSLALRYAEPYALVAAPVLGALSFLARPIVWVLTGTSNLFLRVFGDSTSFSETRLSRDELSQLVDEAANTGSVGRNVGEIANRALAFEDLDAAAVMVPRNHIVSVPIDVTLSEVARIANADGPSRVPVYDHDRDDLQGYLNVREVLARAQHDPSVRPRDLVRKMPFLPASMSASSALRSMQSARTHIAAVVDEQGSLRGLLTIEDLVEELVGEIWSENDRPEEALTREADGAIVVPAETRLHELARDVGIELPEASSSSTVGGLCLELAGRIPEAGVRLRAGDFDLVIVEATPRKVRNVRIERVRDVGAA